MSVGGIRSVRAVHNHLVCIKVCDGCMHVARSLFTPLARPCHCRDRPGDLLIHSLTHSLLAQDRQVILSQSVFGGLSEREDLLGRPKQAACFERGASHSSSSSQSSLLTNLRKFSCYETDFVTMVTQVTYKSH